MGKDHQIGAADGLLEEALSAYGYSRGDAVLIRHNENLTYRVRDALLLRIHRPKPGFSMLWLTDAQDRAALRGEELRFLRYLAGCGLSVQTPVANAAGEFVTVLSDGTLASALGWIPGRTVEDADITEPFCRELGALVGRLHEAARSYPGGPNVRYDAALCDRLRLLFEACPDTPLWQACRKDVVGALACIRAYLAEHAHEFAVVHSDLSCSNLLITPEGLVPIDFSLFGFGHPMLDVGGLHANVCEEASQRAAFAAGYAEQTGRRVDAAGADAMFAFQVLLGIALHLRLWDNEEWFQRRLPEWCRDIFGPLARGERQQ